MPAWFMSDDAEQFYTAWIAVFGPGPKNILCTWHIDRVWRTNLKSLIGNRSQSVPQFKGVGWRKPAYPHLKVCFKKPLSSYNLLFPVQQWAACYRKGSLC